MVKHIGHMARHVETSSETSGTGSGHDLGSVLPISAARPRLGPPPFGLAMPVGSLGVGW